MQWGSSSHAARFSHTSGRKPAICCCYENVCLGGIWRRRGAHSNLRIHILRRQCRPELPQVENTDVSLSPSRAYAFINTNSILCHCMWPNGLEVRYLLWVEFGDKPILELQVTPGSNPGWAHLFFQLHFIIISQDRTDLSLWTNPTYYLVTSSSSHASPVGSNSHTTRQEGIYRYNMNQEIHLNPHAQNSHRVTGGLRGPSTNASSGRPITVTAPSPRPTFDSKYSRSDFSLSVCVRPNGSGVYGISEMLGFCSTRTCSSCGCVRARRQKHQARRTSYTTYTAPC